MITKLNLATNPFRNRNLPYILALLLLAVTVAGAVLSFARVRENNSRIELTRISVTEMDNEVKRLKGEGERKEGTP